MVFNQNKLLYIGAVTYLNYNYLHWEYLQVLQLLTLLYKTLPQRNQEREMRIRFFGNIFEPCVKIQKGYVNFITYSYFKVKIQANFTDLLCMNTN